MMREIGFLPLNPSEVSAMVPPRLLAAMVLVFVTVGPAPAHYNMLLLEPSSASKGEAVTLTYQWGHPFEHQLFDAPAPRSLVVIAPDGTRTDVTKSLEKIAQPAGADKKVTAYRLKYTPQQRGDHVFLLNTPPIWMEEEQEFYQDTVKVVLHVQAQKGWDHATRDAFEFLPLTRPYGLLPGTVFQAQVMFEANPFSGALVEIERYNATPPRELPADEFITRTAKTDPNGVVTCSLPEAGWWCLTTQRKSGTREREGKKYPLKQRTTFWLLVDEKPRPAREAEK
jgi:cobalt/nickel transport protein